MIRQETATDWVLITHPDHARLAGRFADAWGNERFARPEPYQDIRYAVYHHDDGWLARDAAPSLTPAGLPEAFTRTLVGAYSAFEEIDLPAYLAVRARATAEVAEVNPYAGILVSMHTYNLLSEQADLDSIRPEHRDAHARFLDEQKSWQQETAARLGAAPEALLRGFEFLQCCDNLSLIVCSGYEQPRTLRHTHPDADGVRHTIRCAPAGADTYTLDPWPLAPDELELEIPCRQVPKAEATTTGAFRAAFAAAPVATRRVTLRRAAA
ncbi:hypothetical protein OpiT1DRAFT_03068 [Opitutaceae bacterium TAV1]|nr:hypothetical protein OpiT1DRAFT_03068 [Opitutaceae bacterium TAV1]